MQADCRLPPLHHDDNPSVDFRSILIEREGLGIEKVGERAIAAIRMRGYDDYFIDLMNSSSRIGGKAFYLLATIDRLDLTTEYNVFHNFREQLNHYSRRRIASLLLRETKRYH